MANRHIAGSGARAGQWVPCPSLKCRLGGPHISERDFYAVKSWLAETGKAKKATEITAHDYTDFKAATAGKEAEWAVKAEKLARKDKGFRDADVPVFEGEENLIQVGPKEVVKDTPVPRKDMSHMKDPMEDPDAKVFIKTGDIKALRRFRHSGNFTDDQFNAVLIARLTLTNQGDMDTLEFYSEKSGEIYRLREIPEVREYIRTGSQKKFDELAKEYYLPKKALYIVARLRKHEEERQRGRKKGFLKRLYKKI